MDCSALLQLELANCFGDCSSKSIGDTKPSHTNANAESIFQPMPRSCREPISESHCSSLSLLGMHQGSTLLPGASGCMASSLFTDMALCCQC